MTINSVLAAGDSCNWEGGVSDLLSGRMDLLSLAAPGGAIGHSRRYPIGVNWVRLSAASEEEESSAINNSFVTLKDAEVRLIYSDRVGSNPQSRPNKIYPQRTSCRPWARKVSAKHPRRSLTSFPPGLRNAWPWTPTFGLQPPTVAAPHREKIICWLRSFDFEDSPQAANPWSPIGFDGWFTFAVAANSSSQQHRPCGPLKVSRFFLDTTQPPTWPAKSRCPPFRA